MIKRPNLQICVKEELRYKLMALENLFNGIITGRSAKLGTKGNLSE
jgi:hypothetical protein